MAKGLRTPGKGSPGSSSLTGAQSCILGQLQDGYAAMMQKAGARACGCNCCLSVASNAFPTVRRP